MGSTRVIVDTASSSDCGNECPVLSLADYAARNGAFAGVNGSYFCPIDYASCAGKTNTFDTLAMNKDKYYFNSGNNVYSTVPAIIFGSGGARLVKQSLEWGRDTGVDGVLANYPILTFNGAIDYSGSSDGKLTNKGGRSFVGFTGSTIYIGVVHSATVAESAKVMQTLGIHNSLNLDNGGSTALWSGGYKAGPGRQLPNAILFISR
ncbi:phosphodiester glycosidase family protein [Candidatus Microgenomates bacterium]|nr:phosphodiester glycosidase family protein [Candidatus Microgenomates bacterium]